MMVSLQGLATESWLQSLALMLGGLANTFMCKIGGVTL